MTLSESGRTFTFSAVADAIRIPPDMNCWNPKPVTISKGVPDARLAQVPHLPPSLRNLRGVWREKAGARERGSPE
jgi:hypothetical protein